VTTPYVARLRAAADVLPVAPAWLAPVRARALARFEALGFPTTRDEDWHFTSVTPIAEAGYVPAAGAGDASGAPDRGAFTFGHGDWPTAVFVDGRFAPALSTLTAMPAGVTVTGMADALAAGDPLVEQHLGSLADAEGQAFTALATAFLQDGAVVRIAREAIADQPVHLLFLATPSAAGRMLTPRTLVVAERFSTATLIETYAGPADVPYLTNQVTEVLLEDGATLHHLRIQREGLAAHHVGTVETRQARDSHYVSFSFATGAALSRTNILTVLDGEGCGATLNGLYMLDGRQHCDHQTRIEHAQPNCFSREVYKGILDGESHGVFNGKVYVHPIAQKTDGKQTNNTLLLSERAQIDTKPQLEIFADDVKCTHGATVGRLDELSAFYMKSRGVSAATTRSLLTYAFAAEVLETIEQADVKDALEALTLERYAGQQAVGAR
jgi:Fe-S cluster assembly protein SufD